MTTQHFKWEPTFTKIAIIIGVLMVIAFFCFGCTTTREIQKTEESRTTIQPVTFPVPEVIGKFNIPLIRVDTVKEKEPEEVYQTTQTVETKDPLTGKTSKAVVDLKQTRKKDSKGKPFLETDARVRQDPVTTDAKVKEENIKINSDTTTKGLMASVFPYLVGLIIFIIILIGVVAFAYAKKLLPIGWASFITTKILKK